MLYSLASSNHSAANAHVFLCHLAGGQRHISTLSLRAAVRMRAFWVILVFESGSLLFGLDDWFLVFKTPSPEESFWLNFACLVAGMMFLAGSTTAFVTFWASAPREWSRYDTLKQAVGERRALIRVQPLAPPPPKTNSKV